MFRIQPRFAASFVAIALGLAACGGDDGSSAPDFAIAVAPTSLTATEGGATGAATVSIDPASGFTGSVKVEILGLPAGATTDPPSPFSVSADSPGSFTVATSGATPTGTVSLTVHATSGARAHDATLSLTTNPLVTTSQNGTVLYLASHANGHTARIGLDTNWGGAVVEVSLDGINFVNAHDTGREVQPALYDSAAQYPSTACTNQYGWDPVMGGDYYDHGSPVLNQAVAAGSLYTKTTPVQWCPGQFGGGPATPAPADMTFEQTVTLAPQAPLAFQVHYKLTHNGVDTHYNSGQEFPAVYVNSAYTTLAYYGGLSPWTDGALTLMASPAAPAELDVYAPEQSAALVDANNQGLTVFVPGVYPSWTTTSFLQSGGTGPLGNATVYMRPLTEFTIAPGAVIEGDIYLVPGDATLARSVVYGLHHALPASNITTALGTLDVPAANATVSGAGTQVAGWAFGRVAVSSVTVYVDGTLKGSATLGVSRPDVAAAFPHLAPPDSGWTFAFDTTTLANGMHSITIHVTDTSNNEALLPPVPVTVSN